MSEPFSFVFPESVVVGPYSEAKIWVHGGCPYCDSIMRGAKRLRGWRVVWNTKTRDVVALVPP